MNTIAWAERRWLPDWLVRLGIRRLLAARLQQESSGQAESESLRVFAEQLKLEPVAILTDKANEQHYEVPAEFFQTVLGPRLKYSCCWYSDELTGLATAEEAMLRLTCERAEIEDGMRIVDLGCGWGSLTLWLAQHYPHAQITSVSNSHGQREYIQGRCRALGLNNVQVLTANVRDFDGVRSVDRVVSIEMFEHVRNYEQLLRRIRGWLNPHGKLFVHIFCHRALAYRFETEGEDNWMGRHFFSGGLMPAFDLFSHFQEDLRIARRWMVDGRHYARTCWDWLAKLDQQQAEVIKLFARELDEPEARLAVQRWRMFFMACAELFQYRQGSEWFVGHYLFEPARDVE
jgi:cyclopropane-fatty-acyl-phospholipid synthase